MNNNNNNNKYKVERCPLINCGIQEKCGPQVLAHLEPCTVQIFQLGNIKK